MKIAGYALYAIVAAALVVIAAGVFFVMLPQGITGEAAGSSSETAGQAADAPEEQPGEEQDEQQVSPDDTQDGQERTQAEQEEELAEEQQEPEFIPVSSEPDIAIIGIAYEPDMPRTTDDITFVAEIQNLGGKAAQIRKYKLVPFVDSASEIEAASAEKSFLQPGEKTEIRAVWRIRVTGLVDVVTGIDVYDEIEEYDESNNELRMRLRMQPANGFVGCLGFKTDVCRDMVEDYPDYFSENPQCSQVECESGPKTMCSEECPHPRGQ